MSNLFSKYQAPLAERLRPQSLSEVVGQQHILGKDGFIYQTIKNGSLSSIILWGPPGIGKTTIANILAKSINRQFFKLSAINAGVKEIREVIQKSESLGNAVVFIDEIHRFNKSQQDALLAAVEKGTITLIGATTENPSFEVNSALLSRCQVIVLKALEKIDLETLLTRTIKQDEVFKNKKINVVETEMLFRLSGGDARKLLNLVEMVLLSQSEEELIIDNARVEKVATTKMALYDKKGEQHYDIISAFIKSMRGSDPEASVYWLARMIEGGEDVKFIARRMLILAAEDIGLANPTALVLANTTFDAVSKIGLPEARIILSECALYLATSPKSNSSYVAIDKALDIVRKTGDLPVPLEIRNAPTKLMKELGYGENYKYAHAYKGNFVEMNFLPDELGKTNFYEPGNNARELDIKKYLEAKWNNKKDKE